MNICYPCQKEHHEDCSGGFLIGDLIRVKCSCEVRKHSYKTYVIQVTFEVQEFSPSNAKSVLTDLLARNSKLPAMTNMEIVSPVEKNLCICGHFLDNHKSAIEGGNRICTICPCIFYEAK